MAETWWQSASQKRPRPRCRPPPPPLLLHYELGCATVRAVAGIANSSLSSFLSPSLSFIAHFLQLLCSVSLGIRPLLSAWLCCVSQTPRSTAIAVSTVWPAGSPNHFAHLPPSTLNADNDGISEFKAARAFRPTSKHHTLVSHIETRTLQTSTSASAHKHCPCDCSTPSRYNHWLEGISIESTSSSGPSFLHS